MGEARHVGVGTPLPLAATDGREHLHAIRCDQLHAQRLRPTLHVNDSAQRIPPSDCSANGAQSALHERVCAQHTGAVGRGGRVEECEPGRGRWRWECEWVGRVREMGSVGVGGAEDAPKLRRGVKASNWQAERQRWRELHAESDAAPVVRSRGGSHVHSDGLGHGKKASISERERLRKAGDLVEPQPLNSFDLQPPVAHRSKATVTFSERQRRRKRFNGFSLTENECYDSLDQLFPGARADYAVWEAPTARRTRPPQSVWDSWNAGIRRVWEERVGGHFSWPVQRGGDVQAEAADSVAGQLQTAAAVPEFPAQCQGSESEKEESSEDAGDEGAGPGPRPPTVRQFRFRLKLGANGRRLLSGAIAGAFSRTAVAPLETIRTHLMVGSHGRSVGEVFEWIVSNEGWQGLFRGNAINVIRVAPSKAVEVCTPCCSSLLNPLCHELPPFFFFFISADVELRRIPVLMLYPGVQRNHDSVSFVPTASS